MEFRIDEEIKQYMWDPDDACQEELERNLRAEGKARDPLVVAKLPDGDCILVDGHRRYAICQKHSLPYETVTVPLQSREDIFSYMDVIQAGRRNLDRHQMSVVRGRVKQLRQGKAEKKKKTKAVAEQAKREGVTPRTLYRNAKHAEAVEKLAPEIQEQAVAKYSQEDTIALANLPKKQQVELVKAGKKPARKGGTAYDKAQKAVARLQNLLADLHEEKPDAIRLRSARGRAKEIGTILDSWGEGYDG